MNKDFGGPRMYIQKTDRNPYAPGVKGFYVTLNSYNDQHKMTASSDVAGPFRTKQRADARFLELVTADNYWFLGIRGPEHQPKYPLRGTGTVWYTYTAAMLTHIERLIAEKKEVA